MLDSFTRILQKDLLSLLNCQGALDGIIKAVQDEERPLAGCKIGVGYIGKDSKHVTSKNFENAVCLIQANKKQEMSAAERAAVEDFVIPDPSSPPRRNKRTARASSEGGTKKKGRNSSGAASRILKRQKTDNGAVGERYINLDFIVGSAAVVESMWSEADVILIKRRRCMSPYVFEAILFLKSNRELWDIISVQKAMLMSQPSRRTQNNIDEDANFIDEHGDDDENNE